MNRATRLALASVGMAWAGLALAEPTCAYREEEVSLPAASKDSVTLLSVDPPEGAELRKEMGLSVDAQFQIADFEPDTYFTIVLFPTAGFGAMSPGDSSDTPMLEHASGKVHLCVPLQEVYDHPRMTWPLSITVLLLKKGEANQSASVASSRKVAFKSPDAPAGRKALPDEYFDALTRTNSFFDNRQAIYKVCIARYPAMQPAFTKAYRAWEARHRANIELVAELQFEHYKEITKGRADSAANLADSMTASTRQRYEGMKPASLKQECDRELAEFVDPDDTTDLIIGDELEVLRQHSGKAAEKNK